MKRLLDKLFSWLLMLGLTFGGAYSAYWGITQESLARASSKWPSVTGKIISSYIEVARGKSTSYTPKVQYQYRLNGAVFENDQIYFGGPSSNKNDAAETTAKYPIGEAVTVYYKPEAPETSCLEPGKYRHISAIFVVIGFMYFSIGFAMLIGYFVVFAGRSAK